MTQPTTGEPTYTDDDGVVRPGSQPMNSVVTPAVVNSAESAWADFAKANQMRNMFSAQNPNISDPYSPLESLIIDAFERFGNMSADTIDGDIKRILLRFANRIVEDIRIHPYSTINDLDYYKHIQDIRPIPDEIMIAGIAYHYAKWQSSARAAILYGEYQQTMHQILYHRKFGAGRIQMNTVDKDTRTQYSSPQRGISAPDVDDGS